MIVYPNAKINLGLHVVEKRPDGYHNLETVFVPVPLTDCLEMVPSEMMSFSSSGIELDCSAEQNLCMRTYATLQDKFPDLPNVRIHLHKKIPFGAGLGGGSSDAAFVVLLANELFSLGMEEAEMTEVVTPIGADCPFFIYNKPMFAEGTGNEFSEVNLDLFGNWFVLVKPAVNVTTAQAYGGISPRKPTYDIRSIINKPISEWKNLLVNDFEASVFPQFPEIETVKQKLYSLGADYASMTGSGSAVFGLFTEEPDINTLFDDSFVFTARL